MRVLLLLLLAAPGVASFYRMAGKAAATTARARLLQEAGEGQTEQHARSVLAGKAQDHLKAARKLLEVLEAELQRARKTEHKFSNLYERGLVARRERDEAAAQVAALQHRVSSQRQVCLATRLLIAELPPGGSAERWDPTASRGTKADWTVDLVPELANFFWHRFGKELPISAFGQTPTHDALGFDHRDRVDLALHPGSLEGAAVMEYLNERRLPFQAFSSSRTGSATGAHIHVGPASTRLLE